MSGIEDRCAQFHEAATGSGKSKGAAKEIATLRKFLFRNQTQRFSDKASARLIDTIAIYAHQEDGEGLLDDALKMPFTVFSTKQKSKMLKWMEDRKRASGATEKATTGSSPTVIQLSVIDMQDNALSLMNEVTGEIYEDVLLPEGDIGKAIQKTFDASDDTLDVFATIEDERITIRDIQI